jgi:hypothetical protein
VVVGAMYDIHTGGIDFMVDEALGLNRESLAARSYA